MRIIAIITFSEIIQAIVGRLDLRNGSFDRLLHRWRMLSGNAQQVTWNNPMVLPLPLL